MNYELKMFLRAEAELILILYFEPHTALPLSAVRVSELSGNPITVSWHLGQIIEQNINEMPPPPPLSAVTKDVY